MDTFSGSPSFLTDTPEPILIVHKTGIWANAAFFLLGGWQLSDRVDISRVVDTAEQQRIRSVTGIDQAFQKPGQLEVQYRLAAGGSRALWLHFRPLLPANWAGDVGDGRCEGSTLVICSCAWLPMIDHRELFYRYLPHRVDAWDVDFENRDIRCWFYNENVAKFVSAKDSSEHLGHLLYQDIHFPREEVDWWVQQFGDMLRRGLEEMDVQRTYTWHGQCVVLKSHLRHLPGLWTEKGLPRFFHYSEDIARYISLAEELALSQKQVELGARRLELLEHFFQDAPVVMGLVQLLLEDAANETAGRPRDFLHLLSNNPNREHCTGSQVLPSAKDVALWIDRFLEAEQRKAPVRFNWRDSGCDSQSPCWYSVTVRWHAARRFTYLMSDITAQMTYSQELERAVDARTEELRLALQVKSRFLATVSHELRTPLTGIVGVSALLRDSLASVLSAQQADLLHILSVCGNQLTAVVDDMLDIARTDLTGRPWQLELQQFSPGQLLQEALAISAEALTVEQKKLVDLVNDVQLQELPVRVVGDPRRIRQIVINLLQNALKFTTEGEVVLHASGGVTSGDHEFRLKIRVSDTGVGIAQNVRHKLFRLFSQGDDSTTRAAGGTGLGLYICKRLLDAMHGDISFESVEGRGTVFHVEFPLAMPSDVPPPCPPPSAPCPPPSTTMVPLVATIKWARPGCWLERQLRTHGVLLQRYSSVQEAAAVACKTPILVAGGAACRLSSNPSVSIVLVDYDKPAVLPPGVVFLRKPLPPEAIISALQSFSSNSMAASVMPGDSSSAALLAKKVPPPKQHSRRDASLLVAEDNATNQKILRRMLETLGWGNICFADNGLEAVRMAEQRALAGEPFQVILMDIMMPIMDGLEATQRIRACTAGGSHPPIIALTADASAERRLQCQQIGMADFLTKPVALQELKRCLARFHE